MCVCAQRKSASLDPEGLWELGPLRGYWEMPSFLHARPPAQPGVRAPSTTGCGPVLTFPPAHLPLPQRQSPAWKPANKRTCWQHRAWGAGRLWARENTHGLGALRLQYRLFIVNCSDLVKNLKDSVDNHPYFSATDGAAIIRCLFLGDSAVPMRRHLAWCRNTSLKVVFIF